MMFAWRVEQGRWCRNMASLNHVLANPIIDGAPYDYLLRVSRRHQKCGAGIIPETVHMCIGMFTFV